MDEQAASDRPHSGAPATHRHRYDGASDAGSGLVRRRHPRQLRRALLRNPSSRGPVIDAGMGRGNAFIEQIYAPETVDISDALTSCEVDLAQVQALVLTHLHFDHCGQARRFAVPTFVQRAELEAARAPGYTVPEWIPDGDVRPLDGDAQIATGVWVLATTHTPSHQSVVADAHGQAAQSSCDRLATAPETLQRRTRCRTATTRNSRSRGRRSTGCGPLRPRRSISATTTTRCRSSHRPTPRIVPRRNCHAANAALRF